MSDTSSAIRAAREVQADTLAPELYRQANEWFFKAKNEYKLKNFSEAREYADKARRYAENAEFEAIRGGGNRTEAVTTDPLASGVNNPSPEAPIAAPSPPPYEYPVPQGSMSDPTLNPGTAPTPPHPSP
jgi:hypothetical protein